MKNNFKFPNWCCPESSHRFISGIFHITQHQKRTEDPAPNYQDRTTSTPISPTNYSQRELGKGSTVINHHTPVLLAHLVSRGILRVTTVRAPHKKRANQPKRPQFLTVSGKDSVLQAQNGTSSTPNARPVQIRFPK